MNKCIAVVTILAILGFYGIVGHNLYKWEHGGKKEWFRKYGTEGLCQEYQTKMKIWKARYGWRWMFEMNKDGSIDEWFPE